MAPRTLYILYNANASLLGKLSYGYKHITCSKPDDPTCAACEITHGGLSLKETEAWKAAKGQIKVADPELEIKQLHRDEVGSEVKEWIKTKGVEYPAVLISAEGAEKFDVVANRGELGKLGGDAERLVELLREKGVLSK